MFASAMVNLSNGEVSAMAHVISVINLKGGVGKTTTAVALAETLSAEFRKKILFIDLDPQTNATTMLVGEERWKELNTAERTLARMFKDALEPANRKFDFGATLQREVSDVATARSIDLLPSSLDLIDVQDRLAAVPRGEFYSIIPTELLMRTVKPRLREYDIVIVDCPPNLGIITLNGLRISQGYIIPTIPDILSTYGIPQIVRRVEKFAEEIAEPITAFGVIATKYQSNSTVHATTLLRLSGDKFAPIFETFIPQANDIAAAAEWSKDRRTLKQKYGYRGLADSYKELAQELVHKIEAGS